MDRNPGLRGGPIKAVIFDYGNVLCRLDRPAVERAFASRCPLRPEEVAEKIWSYEIVLDAETGRIDSRTHYELIRDAIGAEASWTYAEFERDYMACLRPNPDGVAALLAAAKAGLRTFVLSNTSFLHSRAIFLDETLATVPEIHALSFKIGFMKPDPRIWRWLLDRAGLEARECVYVDDVQAYCDAAARLGMRAIRYDLREENLSRKLDAAL